MARPEPYHFRDRDFKGAAHGLCDMVMTAALWWDTLSWTGSYTASVVHGFVALIAWLTLNHASDTTSLPSAAWRALGSYTLVGLFAEISKIYCSNCSRFSPSFILPLSLISLGVS